MIYKYCIIKSGMKRNEYKVTQIRKYEIIKLKLIKNLITYEKVKDIK